MKSYKCMTQNGMLCFVRETRDTHGLTYDVWSSRTHEWRPSETAAGAFIGFENGIWNTISEKEVFAKTKQLDQNNTDVVSSFVERKPVGKRAVL